MTDFSFCPSCKAPADPLKNGLLRYNHGPECRVGHVQRQYPVGTLGPPPPPVFQGRSGTLQCSRCGALHSPGALPGEPREGSWLPNSECPICWARAEALAAILVPRYAPNEPIEILPLGPPAALPEIPLSEVFLTTTKL